MRTVGFRRLLLASCFSLLLAACAAGSVSTESGRLNQATESATIQLPKSYHCQNLHVKTGNCPPR